MSLPAWLEMCYCSHYLGNTEPTGWGTLLFLHLLGRLVCEFEFLEHSFGKQGSTLLHKLASQTPDPCVIFNCPESPLPRPSQYN